MPLEIWYVTVERGARNARESQHVKGYDDALQYAQREAKRLECSFTVDRAAHVIRVHASAYYRRNRNAR